MNRFGSKLADAWVGGLSSFLASALIIWLGWVLGQRDPWFLIVSLVLVLIAGIVALVLIWKKYPALRLGLLLGWGLALLNPLTIGLGIIGFLTLMGPPG